MRSQGGNARRRLWAFTLGAPLLSAIIIFALWRWRPFFEPVARLLEEIVLHRRSHGHTYNPALYWLYSAFVALVGLISMGLGVAALRDRQAAAKRLDAYLDRKHASRAAGQDARHHIID